MTSPLNQQKIDKLDDRIKKLTAGLPSRDEQIRRLIEDRLIGFNKFKPDAARGKQVFVKNYAICHKLGGEGAKIGPELDGIGIRGATRIMEDLLRPNRNVDQAFRTTTLITTNGLPVSGLLVREDGKVLVLVDSLGEREQRISIDEIEPATRHVSAMSPMPSNLRDAIPESDFYHLIGYLLNSSQSRSILASELIGKLVRTCRSGLYRTALPSSVASVSELLDVAGLCENSVLHHHQQLISIL